MACRVVIFTLLLLTWTTGAKGVSLIVEGSLPRGTATEMTLQVQIKNLTEEDVAGDLEDLVVSRLKIYLPDHPEGSLPIVFSGKDTTGTLSDYEMEFLTQPEQSANEDGLSFDLEMTLRVIDNGSTTSLNSLLEEYQAVKVNAIYQDVTGAETELDTPTSITQENGVANEAPESLAVASTHKSLVFSWADKETIAYNDDSQKAPRGTTVVLIDTTTTESGEYNFLAKTYKEDPGEEEVDGSCTFTTTDTTCNVSPCSNDSDQSPAYIDVSTLENISGIEYRTKATGTKVTFAGLDTTKTYAAFAFYEPSGLILSNCVLGTPIENVSLTELNGADPAGPGNASCFLATAAYGHSLHPHLDLLRAFRDDVLLRFPLTQKLVLWYYEYSPPLAHIIAQSEGLKALTRGLLWPVVALLYLAYHPLVILLGIFFGLMSWSGLKWINRGLEAQR